MGHVNTEARLRPGLGAGGKHGRRWRRKPGHAPNEGLSFANDIAPVPGIARTGTSLTVTGEIPEERLTSLIRQAAHIEQGSRWWLGDLLVYGQQRFGLTYAQAVKAANCRYGTLRNLASVARRVAPEQRRDDLSWNHHRFVADLTPAEQVTWLGRAARDEMSAKRMREAIGDEREAAVAARFEVNQNAGLDATDKWNEAGMAAYPRKERPPRVVVNCASEADRDAFLRVIGEPVIHNRVGGTMSIWYPDRPMDDVSSVQWVEADGE